jgi:hypothetical protein
MMIDIEVFWLNGKRDRIRDLSRADAEEIIEIYEENPNVKFVVRRIPEVWA